MITQGQVPLVMQRYFFLFILLFGILWHIAPVWAGDAQAADKLPRFAALARDEIFVRTGPSLQYPIRWVYQKRGLPVEIIRIYDTWRQIRDVDGSVGWVHHAMLSGYRNAIVQGKDGVLLLKSTEPEAPPVARLEKGVVVAIDTCRGQWCRVKISGFKGWALRANFWGVYADEEID